MFGNLKISSKRGDFYLLLLVYLENRFLEMVGWQAFSVCSGKTDENTCGQPPVGVQFLGQPAHSTPMQTHAMRG